MRPGSIGRRKGDQGEQKASLFKEEGGEGDTEMQAGALTGFLRREGKRVRKGGARLKQLHVVTKRHARKGERTVVKEKFCGMKKLERGSCAPKSRESEGRGGKSQLCNRLTSCGITALTPPLVSGVGVGRVEGGQTNREECHRDPGLSMNVGVKRVRSVGRETGPAL